jgi:hypothetical protein
MEGVDVDPVLTLAMALRASLGGYVLLLGSGISEGIPTGWDVLLPAVLAPTASAHRARRAPNRRGHAVSHPQRTSSTSERAVGDLHERNRWLVGTSLA